MIPPPSMLAPMMATRPVSSPVNGSWPAAEASTGAEATGRGRSLDGLLHGLLARLGRDGLAQDLALLLLRGDRGLLGRCGRGDHGGRRGSRGRGRCRRRSRRGGSATGAGASATGAGVSATGAGVSATGAGAGVSVVAGGVIVSGRRGVGDAGLRAGGRLVHARGAPARRRGRRHDEGSRHCECQRRGEEQPPRAARERVVRHSVSSLGAPVLGGRGATLFGILAAASGLGGCGRPFEAHIGWCGWELERC